MQVPSFFPPSSSAREKTESSATFGKFTAGNSGPKQSQVKKAVFLVLGGLQFFFVLSFFFGGSSSYVEVLTTEGMIAGTTLGEATLTGKALRMAPEDAENFVKGSDLSEIRELRVSRDIAPKAPIPLSILTNKKFPNRATAEVVVGPGMVLFSMKVNTFGVRQFLHRGERVDLLASLDRKTSGGHVPEQKEGLWNPIENTTEEDAAFHTSADTATQTLFKDVQIAAVGPTKEGDADAKSAITFIVTEEQMKLLSFAEENLQFRVVPKNQSPLATTSEKSVPMTREQFLEHPKIKALFEADKLKVIVNPALYNEGTIDSTGTLESAP